MSLARFFARPSRAALDAYRDRQLRSVVRHAYRRVAHYRRAFDEHGVDVESIRGVADLVRLPVLNRATLQDATPDDVVASGVDRSRLVERWSSGSSGRTVTVRRTWWEDRTLAMFRKRAHRQIGISIRDRQMRFQLMRGTHANDAQWPIAVARALGFFRLHCVDCLADSDTICRELQSYRPDVVTAFPNVLGRLADDLGQEVLRELGIRLISVGGEMLTPAVRAKIETAFGVPVVNKYGAIEHDLLAIECQETGEMHVCDDGLIIEILRDGQPVAPGETGEVVMTSLQLFAMPLIRYRIGDVAIRGSAQCACGAPWSTIKGLRGRMTDYMPLPGGRLCNPLGVTTPMLAAHEWINVYRLEQERVDLVVLRIVPKPRPSQEQLAALRALLVGHLGAGVEVHVELVESIPQDPSGKQRLTRSHVRSPYDDLDWDALR